MSSSIQPRAVVEIMLNCLTFEDVTDKSRGNVTVEEEDPDAWPDRTVTVCRGTQADRAAASLPDPCGIPRKGGP